MNTESTPVETKITREALIVKMVEHRMGNWDSGDTRDAICEGRNGFYEMTNEELEEIALDSYELCDDEGNVVAYKITDPCPIGATPEEISRDMLKALKDIDLRATQARLASSIVKKKNQTEFLLGELARLQAVAIAAIAKTEGKS